MTTDSKVRPIGPGRPRDMSIDQRVLDAAAKLLEKGGLDNVRVDQIARISHTSKASIYRRWPSVTHIIVSVLIEKWKKVEFEPSGQPIRDLRKLMPMAVDSITQDTPMFNRVVLSILATGDKELLEQFLSVVIYPVRNYVIEIVKAAQKEGSVRTDFDAEWAFEMFVAPLQYKAMVLGEKVKPEDVTQHLDRLLKLLDPDK